VPNYWESSQKSSQTKKGKISTSKLNLSQMQNKQGDQKSREKHPIFQKLPNRQNIFIRLQLEPVSKQQGDRKVGKSKQILKN
jgi:hypothetical protein